jgi:hypothetical protein
VKERKRRFQIVKLEERIAPGIRYRSYGRCGDKSNVSCGKVC